MMMTMLDYLTYIRLKHAYEFIKKYLPSVIVHFFCYEYVHFSSTHSYFFFL